MKRVLFWTSIVVAGVAVAFLLEGVVMWFVLAAYAGDL